MVSDLYDVDISERPGVVPTLTGKPRRSRESSSETSRRRGDTVPRTWLGGFCERPGRVPIAASHDFNRDPFSRKVAFQVADFFINDFRKMSVFGFPDQRLAADMGRGHDFADAVCRSDPCHFDGFTDIGNPVVDTGEDVAVEINHGEVLGSRCRVSGRNKSA